MLFWISITNGSVSCLIRLFKTSKNLHISGVLVREKLVTGSVPAVTLKEKSHELPKRVPKTRAKRA